MSRELCLLHANCQGEALKLLLEASPDFASKFEILYIKNYEKQPLEQKCLDKTGLFLHQYLGDEWGELGTKSVLKRLPQNAKQLCIPNCFFKGYWPLWRMMEDKRDFADALLEVLFEKGLSDEEILRIYMKGPTPLLGDVEKNAQDSINIESAKETLTPVKYVDFIRERWRNEQVFITVNHPGAQLLVHIAQGILRQLGLALVPSDFASAYKTPYDSFWLPIHPAVGQMLRLPFVSENRRYPCYGTDLTFYEYTCIYMACQRNNVVDLASALHAHSIELHKVKICT